MPETITSQNVGEWAVFNDSGWGCDPRYETREILKVTDKTVSTAAMYNSSRLMRHSKSDIGWAGPETDAKRLVEQLNSSVGLMKDERRKSLERMAARNADLVRRASKSESPNV